MTSTFTTNLSLQEQGTGDNSNNWGAQLNANMITIVDQCLGTKLSLSVAGAADVTLSTAQSQNLYFNFTGALTGNINVIYPASAGRIIIVSNNTSGAFTLTVKPSGGTGMLITQGSTQTVQIDGTAGLAQAPTNDILPFEVSLASATTTDLGSTGTNVISITGTTTITSLGSTASINECLYFVRFTGALTLTYNSSTLILPGFASITTAAGDTAIFKYEGSGHWRCMMYQQAATVVGGTGTVNAGTTNQLAYYASSTNAVSGTTAIPNGTTATTQTAADSTTKVATTAFVNSTALTLASGTTAVTQAAANNSTKVATTAFVNGTALTLASGTTATTQAAGNNSTNVATTAFVNGTALTLASGTTSVTQTSNDSSTKVATTAFVNPANSIGANGYIKEASGVIIQWGSVTTSGSTTTAFTFPIAFPNNCFSVVTTTTSGSSNGYFSSTANITTTAVNIDDWNTTSRQVITVDIIAIGN